MKELFILSSVNLSHALFYDIRVTANNNQTDLMKIQLCYN